MRSKFRKLGQIQVKNGCLLLVNPEDIEKGYMNLINLGLAIALEEGKYTVYVEEAKEGIHIKLFPD